MKEYAESLTLHQLKIMRDEWKQVAIAKPFIRFFAIAEYRSLDHIIAIREHKQT